MTTQAYNWQIEVIQSRYHYLHLRSEQAEKIYRYESLESSFPEKHHFTPWEAWDYEHTTFRNILEPEQFSIYEARLKEMVVQYQHDLTAADQERRANRIDLP